MTAEWVVDTWLNELALAPRHQAQRRRGQESRAATRRGSRPDTRRHPRLQAFRRARGPQWGAHQRSTNVEQVLQ